MGRATARILLVLETIAQQPDGLTHGEIADALSIPKSTLTLLLRELAELDCLRLDSHTQRFTIGERVLRLGRNSTDQLDIARRTADLVNALRDRTEESAAVAVLHGNEVVIVAQASARKTLVATMQVGDRAPAPATAAGKAILAYMPPVEAQRVITTSARSRAAAMLPPKVIMQQLAAIRAGSVAYSKEEWLLGIVGIGLPILRGASKEPVGSVSIAMPSSRFDPKTARRLESALRKTALEMRARINS